MEKGARLEGIGRSGRGSWLSIWRDGGFLFCFVLVWFWFVVGSDKYIRS